MVKLLFIFVLFGSRLLDSEGDDVYENGLIGGLCQTVLNELTHGSCHVCSIEGWVLVRLLIFNGLICFSWSGSATAFDLSLAWLPLIVSDVEVKKIGAGCRGNLLGWFDCFSRKNSVLTVCSQALGTRFSIKMPRIFP